MKNACLGFGSLLVALGAFAAGQGCSSNATPAGTSPDGGGLTTDPDGGGGGGGASAGTFWFTNHDLKKVGIAGTDGSEIWSETITEAPKDVVGGGGSAWVLTDKGNVLRYDQTAHTLTATIAAATKPSYILFATNAIWVTDDTDGTECNGVDVGPSKLVRVDPATNTVAKKIAVSATDACPSDRFLGLASNGTSIFLLVNNSFGIARVDPATTTVAARLALGTGGGYGTGHLAVSGTDPWVLNTNTRTIQKLDPTSLAVASTTPISADVVGEWMFGSPDAVYLDATGGLMRLDVKAPATQVIFPGVGAGARAIYKGDYFEGHQNDSFVNTFAFYDATTLARKSGVDDSLVYADRLAFIP